jgi:uncharacterized membrane protein (DUF4010 family)
MFESARPFLLALAIGLLIGIERERAHAGQKVRAPLGSRTFTLLALLGAATAVVDNQALAVVLAVFAGAIVVAGYVKAPLGEDAAGVGATTEVAAMVTFTLGYLVHLQAGLAAMVAVIVLVVLALKPGIHEFAKAGLTQQELRASLTFLVIAFVVLPLLPNRPLDPWGLFNPFRLWLIFALITGIGFAGYFAVRMLGPGRGYAAAGLFGGLVSSTAATLALAQRAEGEGRTTSLANGIILANAASAGAQVVVAGVASPDLVPSVLPVVGAAVAVGVVAAVLGVRRVETEEARSKTETFTIPSPIAFRSSAMLAGLLGIALVATSLAGRWFGSAGVLATSVVAGAAQVHAATLAVSTLEAAGAIGPRDAVLGILVAFLTNMVVKIVITGWIGGRRLLAAVALPLVAMMAAAVVGFLVGPTE